MSGGPGTRPRVSVAIVSWNTRELLERCLESIRPEVESGFCEVVVVDNASSDRSAERVEARFPEVLLIRNAANRGFTRATNQAYERSRAPYVLLLNSDAEVEPGALRRCVEYLERRPRVAVLGCRLVYPDRRPQGSAFRFPCLRSVLLNATHVAQTFPRSPWLNWPRYGHRSWEHAREVDCVMGSFFLVRRSALEEGPLLDEGYFMYGEEADLCYRLRRRGWATVYFPEATVVHHHSGSSRASEVAARVYEAKQRAVLRFLLKWRGPGVAWLANLAMLAGLIPRGAAWAAADLGGALLRGHAPRIERLGRLRSLRFHASACLRPGRLASSWDWTNATGSPHRHGA